jgi:hypothetical protein
VAAERERLDGGEMALLGTLPDAEVAALIGRTETAVRVRRARLKLPTALDRRKDNGKRRERRR